MKIIKKKYTTLVFFIAVLASGTFLFYKYKTPAQIQVNGVEEFQYNRDAQDIKKIMKDDWKLLIESDDYSVEHMLTKRAPSEYEPEYFGKMRIKVVRKDGKVVAFITYYLQQTYQGHILFVAVDKDYRGQGHAKKLIQYALNDLKQMGAVYARLYTKDYNTKAKSLYSDKFGFELYARQKDKDGVHFVKKLD